MTTFFDGPWTMEQLLFAVLVFVAVMCIGGAVVAASAAKRKMIKPRLRELDSFHHHLAGAEEEQSAFLRALTKVGQAVSGEGASQRLRQQLARAGFYDRAAPSMYMGAKILLFAVGLLCALGLFVLTDFSLLAKTILAVWIAGVLFLIPNVVVRARQRHRSKEVEMYLPDAVDLLEVCVSSGMGLDMAWRNVTDEIRRVCPVLADEMTLTNLEIQLGSPRAVAMRNMAKRTGTEELSSLVAMLVQSERFGTSIGETLRTFAMSMRERRSQRAEEIAEKMAVKLLFPMVLCIFPVMLIVLVGPAVLTIFRLISE